MKKHHLLFILLLLALGLALFFWRVRSAAARGEEFSAPLKRGTLMEAVYGIGTVTATKSFQFKMGVVSTIRSLYVEEGDQVQKGDRLVDLEGVSLRAPFAGTVTYLPVKPGETVNAQSVVLTLTDLSDRYVLVSLEQRGVVRVRVGQKARMSFDNMRDQYFEGSVESVYSNENNFLVRIGMKALPPQILPGMTGDVAIGIAEKKDVLLVPVAALDKGGVRVSKNQKKPEFVSVKIGVVDGEMGELVDGDLREGDRLVLPRREQP